MMCPVVYRCAKRRLILKYEAKEKLKNASAAQNINEPKG